MNTATTNITLRLPTALLGQLKLLAIQKQTSITALLTERLVDLVQQESDYEQAKRRFLARMEQGFDLGLNDHTSWTRESLHER